MPVHVSTVPAVKQALADWDVSVTDGLVARWQARIDDTKWVAGEVEDW